MQAKSMISGMLFKSFKAAKCKTSLKLAVARIKLLKNKREAMVRQMRRELSQLLETGQDQNARIRVEHMIKEEKTLSAYDLIEIYCESIVARLPIIESQKNCPIDLKEAISSVIFASPRCADIPELNDIQKHFTAKYGKEFITSALEVRPDSGVNRMITEKLSARAPNAEAKLKILTEVAKEHNIEWEPKAFVDEIQKPKDDRLNGPTSFTSANKMMGSSDLKPSSIHCWNNESTKMVSGNAIASKSAILDTVSSMNIRSPKTSVTPRGLESRSVGGEVNFTYYSKGSASFNCTNWSMEFKDAASAAEAAAESAERASMAARAAAELASRGNISRQNSASHESSSHFIKDEGSESLRSSNLQRTHTLEKPVNVDTINMKSDIQHLQRYGVVRTKSKKEADSLSYNRTTNGDATSNGSCDSSISHAMSRVKPEPNSCYNAQKGFPDESTAKNFKNKNDDQDLLEIHQRYNESASPLYASTFNDCTTWDDSKNATKKASTKSYDGAHISFSDECAARNSKNEKIENDDQGMENLHQRYSESASPLYASTFNDHTVWDDNKNTTKEPGAESYDDSPKGFLDASIAINFKKDKNENVDQGLEYLHQRYNESASLPYANTFDGYTIWDDNKKTKVDSSDVIFYHYNSDADDRPVHGIYSKENLFTSLFRQQREEPCTFYSDMNSQSPKQQTSELQFVTESRHYLGTNTEIKLPSQSATNLTPHYDTDGHSSKNEDEKEKLVDAEAVKPNSLHSESSFRKGSYAVESGHGTSFSDKIEVKEVTLSSLPAASPVVGNKNLEAESSSSGKSWRSFGSSVRNEQQTPRNDSSPRNPDESGRGLKEEDLSCSATADENYEIGGLNLRRLTGGLRNRGYQYSPRGRSLILACSPESKSTSGDAPPVSEKEIVSIVPASTESYEATVVESSNEDSFTKAYASRSRAPRSYTERDLDKKEGQCSRNVLESGAAKTEGSLTSNKSTNDISAVTKRTVASKRSKMPEDLENPVPASCIQRKQRKDDRDLILTSSSTNSISNSYEEQYYNVGSGQCRENARTPRKQNPEVSPTAERSTFSRPSNTLLCSEVQIKGLCDQKSNLKGYDGSSFRSPINYPNLDNKAAEELETLNIVARRATSNLKLSQRARDIPSVAKEDSNARTIYQYVRGTPPEQKIKSLQSSDRPESFSKTIRNAGELNDKVSSEPQQPYSSAEEPSLKHSDKESSTGKGSPNSSKHELEQSPVAEIGGDPKTSNSTGKLISRESCLNKASHVHPKLPDYEVIAAHMRSLRSNRRLS